MMLDKQDVTALHGVKGSQVKIKVVRSQTADPV